MRWASTPTWVAMIGTANKQSFSFRRRGKGRAAPIYAICADCTDFLLKVCAT